MPFISIVLFCACAWFASLPLEGTTSPFFAPLVVLFRFSMPAFQAAGCCVVARVAVEHYHCCVVVQVIVGDYLCCCVDVQVVAEDYRCSCVVLVVPLVSSSIALVG